MAKKKGFSYLVELLRKRRESLGSSASIDAEILRSFSTKLALFVLDSSGFTRLTAKYGIIHYLSLLIHMQDSVIPILEKHGAIYHWIEADNVYATFQSPESAVRSAEEIQNIIGDMSSNDEPQYVEVCIGIGYGDVLHCEKKHIYGQEMNFAAKLGEDIAKPGEILITKSVYDAIGESLPISWSAHSIGIAGTTLRYYSRSAIGT